MIGFLARLVGGALDPLIDQVSTASARLLKRLALFAVAGLCSAVVLIALTIAFDLWVASKLGAIAGALAVAGLYLAVAVAAVLLALRKEKPRTVSADQAESESAAKAEKAASGAQIDDFAAPLMAALAGLGFRREQVAVLAGSSIAKQLGPIPLVGLALIGGFLVGRMWKSWRALLSTDAVASVLGLFGAPPEDEDDDQQAA